MKRCTICGEEKQACQFESDKRKKDGRGTRCKKCKAVIQKKYNAPLVTGIKQPLRKTIKETYRQKQIVKYGIAVVEAMESVKEWE